MQPREKQDHGAIANLRKSLTETSARRKMLELLEVYAVWFNDRRRFQSNPRCTFTLEKTRVVDGGCGVEILMQPQRHVDALAPARLRLAPWIEHAVRCED